MTKAINDNLNSNFEKEFISFFNRIAPQYRRSEVFYDFIVLSAIDIYQTIYQNQADTVLKEHFVKAQKRYTYDEFCQLAQLLAITAKALTEKCYDFLGSVFMSLNLGDNYKGQYFTSSHIADFMAKVTLSDSDTLIKQKGYITLSEPCCGSGAMIIGCINTMIDAGFNPQTQLWVECRDIDFTAAMMCYIQLSLLHIPASIIVGDSLLNETRFQLYTLAHFLGNWQYKLEQTVIIESEMESKAEAVLELEGLPLFAEIEDLAEDEIIFY